MKNYPAKMLATMCIILLTTFGCDDLFRQEDAPGGLTADVARSFYESRATGVLNLKSGNTTGKTIAVKPDWGRSVKSQDDKVEVLTVNLLASRGFGFVDAENEKAFQQTKQVGYMISTTKIVFVKDKKDGSITCFLMTLMGEKGFLEKKNFEIAGGNDYLKKGKDFNGYALFHNLEGNFVNGWKFTNGKVTHTLNFVTGGSLPVGQKSAYVCTTETFTQWYAYPVDAYVEVGDVSVYKGTTFNYYSVTTLATVCNWVDSTGGGGGGTYAPSTQPSLTPTADKIVSDYSNLTNAQKTKFENALKEFKEQNCGSTVIYNAIKDSGFRINVGMNSGLQYEAGYNPSSNTIYFRTDASIISQNLEEELIHAYQDSYYGGTDNYTKGKTGYANIEFEAKVTRDLIRMGCCTALNSNNTPSDIVTKYQNWIWDVRAKSFVFQDADYVKWLNEFNKYQPEYSSSLSSDLMTPRALKSISSKFCNNQN